MGNNDKKKFFISSLAGAILGGVITLYGGTTIGVIQPVKDQEAQNQQAESASVNVPIMKTAQSHDDLVSVIKEVSSSVVGVVNIQRASDFFSQDIKDQESGTGSGVIFKKSGNDAFIVTNHHVIEEANKVEVSLSDGKRVQAKIIGTDPLTDLAVLKIDSQYVKSVANFADSSKLKIGEQVFAIGSPLGLQFSGSVTKGIISGTKRTVPVMTSAGEWDLNVIQTDAAINPGNSGGALMNESGQVIGINSMKISQKDVEGIGFAIPSNDVVPILEKLLKDGKVERPYIGIGLQNIRDIPDYFQDQLNVNEGVLITAVEPSSPGAKAGLKEQDIIVAVNGTEVKGMRELRKVLYENTDEKVVHVTILRNGKEKELEVQYLLR
ncbi:serine protease Do [Oikeobacillus pervagus]|uniref:Serine protease Do n=1 Tax=Oikeobacillus pervagus TaxID=1325931 RepID=A0AAJ1T0Z5_9BACI|nr:trypsin-like peptidase domain-containing protein [Oikeobacillus pervagus]MDQ0216655.1 serine protease Do [Oikeobacillus pervagus]